MGKDNAIVTILISLIRTQYVLGSFAGKGKQTKLLVSTFSSFVTISALGFELEFDCVEKASMSENFIWMCARYNKEAY